MLRYFKSVIIMCYSSTCFADSINLTSGENLNCTFLKFSQYATEIFTHGVKKSIDSRDIESIMTKTPVKVTLDTGENIIGLISFNNNSVQIDSAKFGRIITARKDISAMATTLSDEALKSLDVASQTKDSKKKQTIGEKEEAPPKDFLRGATVLRKPGELEFTLTASYERGRYDNPVISTFMGVLANETRHRFMLDLTTTVGISNRLEGWVNVPFQYAELERVEGIYKDKRNNLGIGDISGGLRYLLMGEGEHTPAITFSTDVIIPTGDSPYSSDPYDAAVAFGSGNWGIRPSINFVTTTDPLIFFYGASYQYQFPSTHYGATYERGDRLGYYGGFGFAVNDRASLSAKVFGEHVFESKKDDKLQYGTSLDPLSIGLSVAYRISDSLVLNPFVNIGANNDAPDYVLGLSFSKTY